PRARARLRPCTRFRLTAQLLAASTLLVRTHEADWLPLRALLLQRAEHLLVLALHFRRDRRASLLQRLLEVRRGDALDGHRLAQRSQPGASDEILEIGAGIALGACGEIVEIDVVGERHGARMNTEDVAASV